VVSKLFWSICLYRRRSQPWSIRPSLWHLSVVSQPDWHQRAGYFCLSIGLMRHMFQCDQSSSEVIFTGCKWWILKCGKTVTVDPNHSNFWMWCALQSCITLTVLPKSIEISTQGSEPEVIFTDLHVNESWNLRTSVRRPKSLKLVNVMYLYKVAPLWDCVPNW
jgi:hypothetical protein